MGRRHSAQVNEAVIQECMRPGISMAALALALALALAHSLNANMLRKWVIDTEHALLHLNPRLRHHCAKRQFRAQRSYRWLWSQLRWKVTTT